MDNIDFDGVTDWGAIGIVGNGAAAFCGIYDGDNKTISNLSTTSTGNYSGILFNNFDNGELKNLTVNVNVDQAGGFGLNLTKATHVIHFDRWWNPAVENQATDRAHRIGQTKTVFVHLFISAGTLEEHVDVMLEKKSRVAGSVITEAEWLEAAKLDE